MSVRDPSVRLVHTVQTVLESGRVADWEALVAQVPPDRLRGAIQTARISQDLRQLAYRLLDTPPARPDCASHVIPPEQHTAETASSGGANNLRALLPRSR